MAHELSKDDMKRLARLGAMRRLEDIRHEEAAIRAAFPELFSDARPAVRAPRTASLPAAAPEKAAATKRARKRSTMSPAMRKAVSERMKKYWAGRRKAKNG